MPERLSYLIRSADHAFTTEMGRVLRGVHLTATQYITLLVLSETDGMSGAQLSRACHVSPQTMAAILSTLAQRGLVDRTPSNLHRQVLVTRMTKAGSELLAAAEIQIRRLEELALQELSSQEHRTLVHLLRRLTELVPGAAGKLL